MKQKQLDLDSKRSGTILLVDDDSQVLRVNQRLLERFGYTVKPALSGRAAMDLFLDAKGNFLCVILDLLMQPMKGTEVFKQIHEINKTIPVIVYSGLTLECMEQLFEGQHPAGYLEKPFTLMALKNKIEEVLCWN